MSSEVNIFVHALCQRSKSALHKKWHVLVPLDGSPYFNHYCIALELLYNMRLEPSFFIERFQSYSTSKITEFQCYHVVFLGGLSNVWSYAKLPSN